MKKTNSRAETRGERDAVLPEFLRPREAAAILRVSGRFLDRCRIRGGGPAYFNFANRIVYARGDLAEWAAARRYRHTAETGEY